MSKIIITGAGDLSACIFKVIFGSSLEVNYHDAQKSYAKHTLADVDIAKKFVGYGPKY